MTDQSVIVNRTEPGRFSHRRYRNLQIVHALISASPLVSRRPRIKFVHA